MNENEKCENCGQPLTDDDVWLMQDVHRRHDQCISVLRMRLEAAKMACDSWRLQAANNAEDITELRAEVARLKEEVADLKMAFRAEEGGT